MVDISQHVRTDHKVVDKHEALHAVKGWLTKATGKVPIILDQGRAIGILNDRALMGRRMDLNAHVDQFTLATRAVTPDTSVEDARARMAMHRAAYLPVEDKAGHVLGYVRAIDLAEWDGQTAHDVAVPVTLLREDQTLGEAIRAFSQEYVEYLPVVSPDGRLGGVLSRGHVLKMEFDARDRGRRDAGGEKLHFLDGTVGGFMDQTPRVTSGDAKAGGLVDRLERQGYVIVGTPEGRPTGVITPETLFRPGGP